MLPMYPLIDPSFDLLFRDILASIARCDHIQTNYISLQAIDVQWEARKKASTYAISGILLLLCLCEAVACNRALCTVAGWTVTLACGYRGRHVHVVFFIEAHGDVLYAARDDGPAAA